MNENGARGGVRPGLALGSGARGGGGRGTITRALTTWSHIVVFSFLWAALAGYTYVLYVRSLYKSTLKQTVLNTEQSHFGRRPFKSRNRRTSRWVSRSSSEVVAPISASTLSTMYSTARIVPIAPPASGP